MNTRRLIGGLIELARWRGRSRRPVPAGSRLPPGARPWPAAEDLDPGRDDDEDGGARVREPRRPRPGGPRGGAAALDLPRDEQVVCVPDPRQ